VDTAVAELFELREKARELFGEIDEALAVTEILEAVFVRLAANLLGEEFFEPIDRIDDERLERGSDREEVVDRRDDIGPVLRPREAGDVEVRRAAFGIEEDRSRGRRRRGSICRRPRARKGRGAWRLG